MHGWLRPVSVLAGGFGGVVLLTLGLAGLLVPDRAPPVPADSSLGPVAAENDRGLDPNTGIPGLGGTITVTGDRDGTFQITREVHQGSYAVEGGGNRITFGGEPVQVAQISYDGLEFFPSERQCSLTTGNLEGAIGIGYADLRCDDLRDIRGGATISLRGEIGLPLDRLVGRQLPETGGTATVGDETWTFDEASLLTWQQPARAGVSDYNLVLEDLGGPPRALGFAYDIQTHALSLANVRVGNSDADVPPGACSFDRTELGRHNPRTLVVELIITCASVDVPGMGAVAIAASAVVDEIQWPE
ncbi:MAG: hypothetical protein M3Y40_08615 [Chloroflexota bacterium]|nr:hypothetical protein [Chloroflexota bacterium]